jgi:hypothetical protein
MSSMYIQIAFPCPQSSTCNACYDIVKKIILPLTMLINCTKLEDLEPSSTRFSYLVILRPSHTYQMILELTVRFISILQGLKTSLSDALIHSICTITIVYNINSQEVRGPHRTSRSYWPNIFHFQINVKFTRYQFLCTRCAFRQSMSPQWCSGRKICKSEILWL